MKPVLKAVALGAAWTAFSVLDGTGWDWMFSYRGLPFRFVERYESDVVIGYQDPHVVWRLLGGGPLIADWLIWTAVAWVCLRLVKGTASALSGATALYCVWGFLHWQKVGDYSAWADWLIVASSVSTYLLLGIYAQRARVAAAFVGAGLFASITAFQAFQDGGLVMSGIIFKLPIAVLLLAAVWFALRHQTPNKALQAAAAAPGK